MRKYTKPAVSEFALNLINIRLQGTAPLIGINCTGCPTSSDVFFDPFHACVENNNDYFINIVLEDTTCEAAALDPSTCTITVGGNVLTNCGSSVQLNGSCEQGSQDCGLQIQCLETGQICQLSDDGATVEIDCPGFEVCSTNLDVEPD